MQNKHTDNKTDDRSKPRAHVERRTALDKALSILNDGYAAGGPAGPPPRPSPSCSRQPSCSP